MDQAVPVLGEVGSYWPEHHREHQDLPNLVGESLVRTVPALQALLDQVQAHACVADQEQIVLEEDPVVDGVVASVAAAVVGERMLFLVLHAWAVHAGEGLMELVVLGRAEDDRVGEERMSWGTRTVRARQRLWLLHLLLTRTMS